jgi:hypothetical protein
MNTTAIDRIESFYSPELKVRLAAQSLYESGLLSMEQFNDICVLVPVAYTEADYSKWNAE